MLSRILLFLLAGLGFFLCVPAGHAGDPPQELPDGWKMVWHDEFEGSALDLAKWTPADAAYKKNNELQYYTPEDVYVRDGHLTLRSQRRRMEKRFFTSGLVDTKGKFSLTSGRVEVRARLPKGQGIWPAHWMMPADGSWPPEIDIAELLGHFPDKVHMTHHFRMPDGSARKHGEVFRGPDFSKDFHVFAVEWERDEIRWYIDRQLRFKSRDNVPSAPMQIILNTAVGGDWPGEPTSKTVFPQHHDIDYVRVYTRDPQAQ